MEAFDSIQIATSTLRNTGFVTNLRKLLM